jgi:23S rRNA pseudouridine1911/1915/1917 synthase
MPKIIFQNQDFIVVEKPAGMAVHPGVNTSGPTLVDFLADMFPEIARVGDAPDVRPGIVHRLDRETSGVMVVARNQKSFEHFKNLFKNREVEKKYLALVHGKLKNKQGKIEGEMGRSKRDFRKQSLVRGKVSVRKERYSLTHYSVLKESDDYSLLEVSPKTGRMHQIRVHLHSIGHPIVGDEKYFFKAHLPRRQAGKKQKHPRMFLHANSIAFRGPDGKQYFFESKPPEEFKNFQKEKP